MSSRPSEPGDRGLDDRFAGLFRRMGIESLLDEIYPEIVNRYSEPGRHYHNLGHVRQCLDVVDRVRGMLRDPDAAELALWFHDIVYDPSSHDNELRSALLFDRLVGVHLPTPRADNVHAMIMATVHPSEATGGDEQFVADIDLSGMGLSWSKFFGDTESLRMECRHLADSEFQLGTVAFFRRLLSRPSIYRTAYFREHFDEQAQCNIDDLLTRLESRQDGD